MTSVTGLLNALKLHQGNEEHSQVYETSSRILESSFDLAILKTCLVALINLDNYELASKILTKYPTSEQDLVLEKAYIYYKLNKAGPLSQILDKDTEHRGLLHLKAQFNYQRGHNKEALDVYRKLIATSAEDELLDLSVNERAVIAQSLMLNEDLASAPLSNDDLTSYDLVFNNSLIELCKGNFDKSIAFLYDAKAKCDEASSSYNEDEKFTELFPILLQLSYVYFKSGQADKSEQILQELLTGVNGYEMDDKLTKLLILNNLYAIKLSSTKINSNIIYSNLKFPNVLSQINLTIPQLQKFKSNERILGLSNGKGSSKLFSLISEIDLDQDEKVIARRLFKLAKLHDDLSLSLLAIQYNNKVANFDNSHILINKLITEETLLTYPSLIVIQVYIYENLNKSIEGILKSLQIEKYDLTTAANYKIFKEISFKLLTVKQDELAFSIANQLHKINPDDKLVSALIKGDQTELSSIKDLISGIDIEGLITEGVEEDKVSRSSRKTKHRVSKSKYKRHKKVPEHLIGKTPDAERWLPLKDRSYYKPKKSKKVNTTQGGSADNSTEMSISSTPSSAGTTATKNNKSQKKKGKKRH